jgi:hypothetical protein
MALAHAEISLAETSLHAGKLWLPPYSLPLNLLDFGTRGVLQVKGQCYNKHLFGLSEANHSAGEQPLSTVMWRNCSVLRRCLVKVIVFGGAYGDKF